LRSLSELCLCSDVPPERVKAKNGQKQAQYGAVMNMQSNQNTFGVDLKSAWCQEPLACCCFTFGAPCGFTACWTRSKVLDTYVEGISDFKCCQGYIPPCCGVSFDGCCPGSILGLCCEGCCFPVLSVSIARIHLMDIKRIKPDPCDWQIIQCSNCLQLVSCILDIVAVFFEPVTYLATLVDCIADAFTFSVAGCMGAQVYHEITKDAELKFKGQPVAVMPPIAMAYPVAMAQPVSQAYPTQGYPVPPQQQYTGAPPSYQMER